MARSPAPASRSSLNPFYALLGVVALGGIAFLVYTVSSREKPTTGPVEVALTAADLNRVQGISIGEADAPVVLMEFADFQCPACGQFAAFIAPLIKERLVEPGIVRYIYYDFPLIDLHPHAFLAARAGRCANEQGRFWEFHDRVYGAQSEWSGSSDPTAQFVRLAAASGAEEDAFEGCLRSDRFAREVTESLRFGEMMRVNGTPTLFVNGKRISPTPASFREIEEIVMAEAGSGSAAGPVGNSVPAPAPAGDSVAAATP
ncbi:MAG: DsbA family protein [Gemmatimonadota bacterium]|nr:DsbA family protein [Gemmatimonadota bacterium]